MINQFKQINGCNCNDNSLQNGVIEDFKDALSTTFFDEIFPKDLKGNRALVTRVEIDTPSILKLGAIVLASIVLIKTLK